MAEPREIPQLTSELVEMSKEYLKQETLEPAKQLGKKAGFGIGGASIIALGAFFLVLALYNGLKIWLPNGDWWVVLARFLAAVGAALGAGLVAWRMQSDNQ